MIDDPSQTPFDDLPPVSSAWAAYYLRNMQAALRDGNVDWTMQALGTLAEQLEIDAGITQWITTRNERGSEYVRQ